MRMRYVLQLSFPQILITPHAEGYSDSEGRQAGSSRGSEEKIEEISKEKVPNRDNDTI
jgi:hypothetical protein